MIVTLVVDTFGINNNGTTISAMRFAESLTERGHTVRVVACGDPTHSGIDPEYGYELYYVPELVIPIISWVACKHNTLFAKPIKAVLKKAIMGADIVHIYQPWPLGCAAERIARRLGIPSIASFHVQPENITYNIGLGWFPLAAHVIYYLMYSIFTGVFRIYTALRNSLLLSSAVMVTVPISMLYQTVLIRIFVLALSGKKAQILFIMC